ncbi:MAG: hypothetical protein U5R46_10975 [Gammaproteobacteria bacterium]|nr:hypothetical protein [Gammaproteobacteria bacterium]
MFEGLGSDIPVTGTVEGDCERVSGEFEFSDAEEPLGFSAPVSAEVSSIEVCLAEEGP